MSPSAVPSRATLWSMALFLLIWAFVYAVHPATSANAQRPAQSATQRAAQYGGAQPQRNAFLSGGARSELVLREILQVLKTMDGRLQRLEKLARELQTKNP